MTSPKQGQLPPEPPFQIEVCWKYDEVFTDSKQISDSQSRTLAIWKPKLRHLDRELLEQKVQELDEKEEAAAPSLTLSRVSLNIQKAMSPRAQQEEIKEEDQCYILGYLALSHTTNPNNNIPVLVVKEGADPNALRPPKQLKVVHQEYLRTTRGGHNAVDVYRYWIDIVPPDGYVAMGSVVIEKYKNPIDENILEHHLTDYLVSKRQSKLYGLNKLRCIEQKYVHRLAQPLVNKLLTSKKPPFKLHRPQPLVVSGIHKLVELPCVLRLPRPVDTQVSESTTGGDTFGGNTQCVHGDEENEMKRAHFTATIHPKVMDQCVALFLHSIRIVEDCPLIISYATHFKLSWSSRKVTTTSNTRAAVWEPVLGPDEFMVGHIAYGDWYVIHSMSLSTIEQIKVNLFTNIPFISFTIIIGIGYVPPHRTRRRCPELLIG